MDAAAHRIMKTARDALVDGFAAGMHQPNPARRHGMNDDQAAAVDYLVSSLWDLMNDDPAPPECQFCAELLTQPTTGRPRRYCRDACRTADFRARQTTDEEPI
jgi:hypothetical protein